MFRIDSTNRQASLPAKVAAESTPGYFANNPGAGAGTKVTGDWLNTVQEELAAVIAGASITLDRTANNQLFLAIQALVAGVMPTGARTGFTGQTAPAGWVMGSGRTIGDATSGSTERANADTQALFTLLWTDYTDADLPVKTSAGGASTRGGSAAADFAAHKRMTLPDYRGRSAVGKSDMGGTDSTRVTVAGTGVDGTVLGKVGGEQTHTLVTGEMPAHTHPFANSLVSTAGSSLNGSQTGNTGSLYDNTATGSTGGGGAHNNMPPFVVETMIIKL